MKKIDLICTYLALGLMAIAFAMLFPVIITGLKSEIEPINVEYYKASELVSDNGRIYLAYDNKEVESTAIANNESWNFRDEGTIDNGKFYFIDTCLGKDYNGYFTIKRVLYNTDAYNKAGEIKMKSKLFETILFILEGCSVVFLLLYMGIDLWNDSKNFAEFQRQLEAEKQT